MFRAILFDFNGVLVDDEELHAASTVAVLLGQGLHFTEADYFAHCLGLNDSGAFEAAFAALGLHRVSEQIEQLVALKAQEYLARARGGVRVFPRARRLVRALQQRFPLALVSGALRSEIDQILNDLGLRDAFVSTVAGEEVARGKPDPEGYLAGMAGLCSAIPELSDLRAEECVAIEDTPNGVRAAQAAGISCVGVASTCPAARLAEADVVVPSLLELDIDEVYQVLDATRASDRSRRG